MRGSLYLGEQPVLKDLLIEFGEGRGGRLLVPGPVIPRVGALHHLSTSNGRHMLIRISDSVNEIDPPDTWIYFEIEQEYPGDEE